MDRRLLAGPSQYLIRMIFMSLSVQFSVIIISLSACTVYVYHKNVEFYEGNSLAVSDIYLVFSLKDEHCFG